MPNEEYQENKNKYSKKKRAEQANFQAIGAKIPPNSLEAEMAVIGSLLLDRQAINKAVEILEPEAFYRNENRQIYETVLAMDQKSLGVDIITLSEELIRKNLLEQIGGRGYLLEIQEQTGSTSNVESYARIVKEKYLKRSLIQVAGAMINSSYDETTDALEEIDNAERAVFEIAEKLQKKSYMGMNRLAQDALELIVRLRERDGSLSGVPTGYTALDKLLGGLQSGDLLIIAGRPSMGKTAFALSMARNIALDYKLPVAFFSIEMSAIQLVMRLVSSEAHINQSLIRSGRVSDEEIQDIIKAFDRLSEAELYIDDSPSLTIFELRAKCRRLKSEHGIKAVFIDYLQIMHPPKADSREREISIISRSLKQLAKELDVPVVALAQLNRGVESRQDKRPMLSDLRESGSIEQDADVIMFVNRPEWYKQATFDDGEPTENKAEIIVGKQRNGPVDDVRLMYLKDYARFENIAYEYNASEPDYPVSSGEDSPF